METEGRAETWGAGESAEHLSQTLEAWPRGKKAVTIGADHYFVAATVKPAK